MKNNWNGNISGMILKEIIAKKSTICETRQYINL